MITFAEKIMRTTVPRNHVAVFFMGQAGIILKNSKGTLVAIDLYLSDCCERYFGFKRLMPKILDADDIEFDIIITTHAHYDHFDIDAMPFLMDNDKSKLYTALDVKELCEQLNLPMDRVKFIGCGNGYVEQDIKIEAVYCDHGELAPYAVGLVLTVEGKTIYITGDTALRTEKIVDIASRQIDLMVAPINGAFGNLDEDEAVTLCEFINPNLIVPCHYWNFAEHGGNPGLFAENMKSRLPDQKYQLMCMGDCIIL